MAREASAAPRTLLHARLHLATSPWIGWLAAQLLGAAPVTIAFVVASGSGSRTLRYLLTLAGVLVVEQVVAVLLRRRIGPEPSSPADFLTLARAAIGATLVALVVAGFAQRPSLTGTLTWITALLGVTALDWLDGPLARWVGPTRLGCVLDIEADSWLTLCCAAGAVVWGGLPWWVLLPPLVRYAHPALALLRGRMPAGGGPWWGQVTGVAQMALLRRNLSPHVIHPLFG